MDADVQDCMMQLALRQFHDETTIYWELENEFFKDPKPSSGFLALWFVDKLLDNRTYHRNDQELSGYKQDFHWWLNRENTRREKNKREDKPPFSEEHIDKMKWSCDLFLMEMASGYFENS